MRALLPLALCSRLIACAAAPAGLLDGEWMPPSKRLSRSVNAVGPSRPIGMSPIGGRVS